MSGNSEAGRTLLVLTGSHRGAASKVGQAIATRLAEVGLPVCTRTMDTVTPAEIAAAPALVLCTSTFGSGGVPPQAVDLLAALEAGEIALANRPVAIAGLGDSSFRDTYNGGCRRFAAALQTAGAELIAPLLLFDASTPHLPPDLAGWVADVRAALAARSIA